MKHALTRQSIANSKMQTNMHTSWNSQCNPDMQCSNTWTMETSHDCKSNTKSIILIIYINNRLFMAPHLVRAQSAYKDQDSLISSHTHRCMCAHTLSHTYMHTPHVHSTNSYITGDGWYNEKKMTDQYAEEKRWVISFLFKKKSEDECLTERGREFQITGSMC